MLITVVAASLFGLDFCTAPNCQLSFGPACDGNKKPTGPDTSDIPRPVFSPVPFGLILTDCLVTGMMALTFDDGPYKYTSEILDVLKRNKVPATFFVVGTNSGKGQIQDPATGYPAIVRRMVAEGHQVRSHTWSHQSLVTLSNEQIVDQIIKNEIALASILGFIPTYFRPPYTQWPQAAIEILLSLGYHVTNYNLDTRDWEGDYSTAQALYLAPLMRSSFASTSFITLAHDIIPSTAHNLTQFMIDEARKAGFRFGTVGDCLGDPETN
ncbi:hypothetical protein VTK73DRAFT_1373 [Phialemonium thermophilum]|uniref:NodB homology domain-containing protein n=1 Tax=Phialemonium thermophilum TaxID=223376 RepID=A0ABR3XAQ7_9PEZI